MRQIIDEAIARHKAGEFAAHSKIYMIDACLRTGHGGDALDDKASRGVCFYALAGTEIYVGRLVGFLLYELLKNRRFLANVLSEIDSTERGSGLGACWPNPARRS